MNAAAKAIDTRTQILDIAEQLARQRGFGGFSYRDISQPLGIKNAAIHYHFPTKADLGVALLTRYGEILSCHTSEFMKHGGCALDQLEGFIAFYGDKICSNQGTCLIATLASEFATVPAAMQEAGKTLSMGIRSWMTKVLDVGRKQGEFKFDGDPADKALLILTSMQGASQLARMTGPATMDAAVRQIRADLGIGSELVRKWDRTEAIA